MTLIYPGTFDPVTKGHINIAKRGATLASKLIVAILHNPNKQPLFPLEERIAFLQDALGSHSNIEIDTFSGLLAEYALEKHATAVLRGVRNYKDFEQEITLATCNNLIFTSQNNASTPLETIFLPADAKYTHVSSSIVREIAYHIYKSNCSDVVLEDMVTSKVRTALKEIW